MLSSRYEIFFYNFMKAHPLHRNLNHLKLNTTTGCYEAEENGITCQLTYQQMNELKNFPTGVKDPTFEQKSSKV